MESKGKGMSTWTTCCLVLNDTQHCYVTGGSTGLGLELAILLTKRGAHVSIVARNKERLQKALESLEVRYRVLSQYAIFSISQNSRQSPEQKLKAYSYSLTDSAGSAAALQEASDDHGGKCPDTVFLCAGASHPGFFIEQDEDSLKRGMDNTYWVQALSALVSHHTHIYIEPSPRPTNNVGSREEDGSRPRPGKDRVCLVNVGIYVCRRVFFIFPWETCSTR